MSGLAWKAHLRPAVMSSDHLVLLAENRHYWLEGSAYVHAAPLLDGSRTDDEIEGCLEDAGVPSMSACFALSHLRALGLVHERPSDRARPTPEEAAFWESLGQDATAVADRLAASRVVLRDAGGTGVDTLRQAIQDAGLSVGVGREHGDLLIAVADDYLDRRLDAINRAALESGAAWMAVKLAGAVPWIGPLFVPGTTGCWECLAQRLRLNRQTEQVIENRLGATARAPLPASESSVMLGAGLVAVEVLRWLATGRLDRLEGSLLRLDLRTNVLTRDALVRRPQCRACGNPEAARGHSSGVDRGSDRLAASPKSPAAGGRHETPEAILAKFEHHVSPHSGVIRSTTESNEDGYVKVVASQTFPMYRYNFRVLYDNLVSRSGGKGLNSTSARATAIGEALERYSGIWQGEEERTLAASHRDLGEDALDPPTLFGFSRRQIDGRDAWNETNDESSAWVPRLFDAALTVDWVPLRSLTQSRTRLAPAAFCYYGHPDLRHMFCSSDSNGCAAGGTFTEAVAHGLLELIERDAAGVWWYNRLSRPAVDLDSFALPLVDRLRDLYTRNGRDIWALDLTTDLGVPVVAAVSARQGTSAADIIYGFGADFDAATALAKALLEMHQSLFSVFKTGPSGATRYRTHLQTARRWFQSATCANQPYLVPSTNFRQRSPDDFSWTPADDWRDEVERCVDRLQRAGLETFVLDQTRADIGLPVCRVIVPGLCHFWPRFRTRRLYDVPVRMGCRTSPTREDDLNPCFIYF